MNNRTMAIQLIKEQATAYQLADRLGKGQILSHLEAVLGRSRKSLIRSLNRELGYSKAKSPPKRLGRPPKYHAEVDAALAFVWQAYNCPCAERLIGELAEAVRIFQRDRMWHYSAATTALLLAMPLGSLKLRCSKLAKQSGLVRGFSTTRSSDLLKNIPVFFGDWSKRGVGYGQVDTVVHSGPKLMGTMAYSVNFVDVATYWQEPVAQLNKGEVATRDSLEIIRDRLPFKLLGVHPDTGSEFINHNLKTWCDEVGIELTRSRPHKKNDNCYVEQRNDVVVRKYLGYARYDCIEAVRVMNKVYEVLRLYINFFQPSFKLVGKRKRSTDGKYVRNYDTPTTPYKRLLARDDIPEATKQQLTRQYETLNPKLLLAKIKILTIKLERVQRELGYHY